MTTGPKTITVSVSLKLTVDPEAWNLAYGTGADRKSVVEDVRSYFLNMAQQCAAAEEGGITEAVRSDR